MCEYAIPGLTVVLWNIDMCLMIIQLSRCNFINRSDIYIYIIGL